MGNGWRPSRDLEALMNSWSPWALATFGRFPGQAKVESHKFRLPTLQVKGVEMGHIKWTAKDSFTPKWCVQWSNLIGFIKISSKNHKENMSFRIFTLKQSEAIWSIYFLQRFFSITYFQPCFPSRTLLCMTSCRTCSKCHTSSTDPCDIYPFQDSLTKMSLKKLLDPSLTHKLFLKDQWLNMIKPCFYPSVQSVHTKKLLFLDVHPHGISSDRLRELLLNFSRHLAMVTVTGRHLDHLGSHDVLNIRIAIENLLNIVEHVIWVSEMLYFESHLNRINRPV